MEIEKKYNVTINGDYSVKEPVVKYSIRYHKGGSGYYSYYYLSVTKGYHEQGHGSNYRMFGFILYADGCTMIPLRTVTRKSVKVERELDAWLEKHVDALHASFLMLNDSNMRCVFNYVLQNLPDGANAIELFGITEEKYNSCDFLPAGYYPVTDSWVRLGLCGDKVDQLYVECKTMQKECDGDARKMAELALVFNHKSWQWAKSDDDVAKVYNDIFKKYDEYLMDTLKDDDLRYYLDFTD